MRHEHMRFRGGPWRGGHGLHEAFDGRFGGGHHRGRRGRPLDQGDLRLLLLSLIAERPSHGYELIRLVEERFGGAYSPSPGVVYPTLTLLEELGYASVQAQEGGRKLYSVTEGGTAHLAGNADHIAMLARRTEEVRAHRNEPPAQLRRAMENLKTALRLKLEGGTLDAARVRAIAAALDAAALAVEDA